MNPRERRSLLSGIIADCTPEELAFISNTVTNILRRDFLQDLPAELSVYILGFIDDPQTLGRAACVSKYWSQLVRDEWLWKRLCNVHGFEPEEELVRNYIMNEPLPPTPGVSSSYRSSSISDTAKTFSFRRHFRMEHVTISNWRAGGTLLRTHRVPLLPHHTAETPPPILDPPPASAIPTSLAVDTDWVVVGLANSRILVFSAKTGVLSRTLVGHGTGVWAVALIKGAGEAKGKERERLNEDEDEQLASESLDDEDVFAEERRLPPAMRHAVGLDQPGPSSSSASSSFRHPPKDTFPGLPSDPAGSSLGWGQPNTLVISGGCDKALRVWDVKSGYCIYVLHGHTSTIRCLKVLHHRPIAVSGSRDCTVRVWDVQKGRLLRVLEGHESSVRSLDVCGNRVVSGSYDTTCRLWDVDTGECLHVLRGHFHQVYSVAFDGLRIASGGIDTTVRVWDAETGACLALLQGHTALVTLLQLTPTVLVTGGSDGRVITFSLAPRPSRSRPHGLSSPSSPSSSQQPSFSVIQKLAAHDSTVTSLQLDDRFLVTAGNDGRVRLFAFDSTTGKCEYVREVTEPSESVWKVGFVRGTCAVMCRRAGKTVMEMWRFRPRS
ncbi:hypothetical protein EIP91_009159 [Steccherinum ochraceum]|uniref:F-box domain-containing protein n=1 Tax=Steccherinum ochraceum TaxID=92696 RepID=A0A4R0RBR0_9APHY|nr:hypothetical protein EIP91_009159 [Steccherinum ochraceum]